MTKNNIKTKKMKECSKCKVKKPSNRKYFHVRNGYGDGFNAQCKDCISEYGKKYRKKRENKPKLSYKELVDNDKKEYENSDIEKWEDVIGYEGYYKVSSLGRVRSLPRIVETSHGKTQVYSGGILSEREVGNGYKAVGLTVEGKKTKSHLVHRLVAKAFMGNKDHLQVNHIDEDRSNNELSNLEWVTPKVNIMYRQEDYSDNYIKANIERLIEVVGKQRFGELVKELIK